jgi:hypothetical protein
MNAVQDIIKYPPDQYNQTLFWNGLNGGLVRFSTTQVQYLLDYAKHGQIQGQEANDTLAGHLRKEYLINNKEVLEKTKDLIFPFAEEVDHELGLVATAMNQLSKETQKKFNPYFSLDDLWVNYQQKHEFNPLHTHTGLYSFVIWLQQPFRIEDENQFGPGAGAPDHEKCCAAFYCQGTHGRNINILVDKTWNATAFIFPATARHGVYPFYTSDDYRITVSGNIYLDLKE